MNKKQLPFYLITTALFLGISGPALFSDGMFIDGLLYAGVSRNLAENLGTFWDLHMTNTLYPHFHGHPPLAFGIQSIFFRIFGDSIFVERIYSLLTYAISGWVITLIWRKITAKKHYSYAWIPLLIWVTIPLVTWASANNMLENTMMIFTSLSVLFLLKSLDSYRFIYLISAGIMLLLAVLTKGLVALFPLSFIFWVFIIKRSIGWKRFIIDTTVFLSALILPLLLIFFIQPESLESLKAYYNEQLIKSIGIQTVNNRFYIIWRLLKELIPAAVLIVIAIAASYRSKVQQQKSKWVYAFLALGLSGVIPIIVSSKQSGFYMIPAFPFFSIAAALLILPHVFLLIEKMKIQSSAYKIIKISSFVLLCASIVIALSQVNKIGRDRKMIEDVHSLVEVIPESSTITVQNELWTKWYLHGYFNRYAGISLESQKSHEHRYILVNKGFEGEILTNYKIIGLDLLLYDLYEKKKTENSSH